MLGVRKVGGTHPEPAVVLDDYRVLTSLYVSSDYSRFLPSLYVVTWRCVISVVDTVFQKLFKKLETGFVQFDATVIEFP
jgi:hypothetical protein